MANLREYSSSSSSQQQHNVISNTVSSEAGGESEPPKTKKAKAVATSTLKRKAVDGKDIAIVKNNKKKRFVLKDDVAEEENNSNRKTTIPTKEEKKLKGAIQRIWSDEDEILVLEQLLDYKKSNPSNPVGNLYSHIKNLLHFDVTRSQFKDKMWKLKQKYKKIVEGRKPIDFGDSHEAKLYELSDKIWRDEIVKIGKDIDFNMVGSVSKENVKLKWPNDFPHINAMLYDFFYETMTDGGRNLMKRVLQYIHIDELKKLEDGWEDFCVNKVTLSKMRMELLEKQAELLSRAMKCYRRQRK